MEHLRSIKLTGRLGHRRDSVKASLLHLVQRTRGQALSRKMKKKKQTPKVTQDGRQRITIVGPKAKVQKLETGRQVLKIPRLHLTGKIQIEHLEKQQRERKKKGGYKERTFFRCKVIEIDVPKLYRIRTGEGEGGEPRRPDRKKQSWT